MLAEQTLCQRPIVMDLMQCFKSAVHTHCRRNGAVLDAVAGPGIVGDDLSGAAPVPDVELVENGISVLCRPDTIFLHELRPNTSGSVQHIYHLGDISGAEWSRLVDFG